MKASQTLPSTNHLSLKTLATEEGISLFGVADIQNLRDRFSSDLQEASSDLPYAISMGKRLSDRVIDSLTDAPTILYLAHYRQVNFLLDRVALKVADFIQEKGFGSLAIAASQLVDWKALRGHLCHRTVAYRAGLGWFGRNNLLINPDLGARVRYVTVLTNFPLSIDEPLSRDCGECFACVHACPANAIGDSSKDFDREACIAQLKIFSKEKNLGQYICGLCIKACRGKIHG